MPHPDRITMSGRVLRLTLRTAQVLLLCSLLACSANRSAYRQAVKDYGRGEYEAALNNAVQTLQKKPYNAKAQDLVKKAYEKALGEREARIQLLQKARERDMWDQICREFEALVGLQELVQPINPLYDKDEESSWAFPQYSYADSLELSRQRAAQGHYDRAVILAESSQDPDIHKEAAREFRLALDFVPAYRDARERFEQARRLAVKRIAILAFEDKSGSNGKYGSVIDLITDSVISRVLRDKTISENIDVITRDQVEALLAEQHLKASSLRDAEIVGNILDVHEIMTGKILQINYVPARSVATERKESKNIILGEEQYTTDKGKVKKRKVKGDVTCWFQLHNKTASVTIIASYSLIRVGDGKVTMQEKSVADYSWSDTWARFVKGDERGLTDATRELMAKEEPFPPSEVEMVNLAIDVLCDEIVDKIRDYVQ